MVWFYPLDVKHGAAFHVQALVRAAVGCPRCPEPGAREMRITQLGTVPGELRESFVTGQGLVHGRAEIFPVQLQLP